MKTDKKIRKLNKRGAVLYSTVLSIVKVIFTGFVALVLVAIVFSTLTVELDSGIPKVRVTMQKIVNSKALIYNDPEINAYYPGIIEWQKFNLDNINKTLTFNRENNLLSMNITLVKQSKAGKTDSKNIIFNKKHYVEMLDRSSMKGKGSTRLFKINQPVLVYDKGLIEQGLVKAEILIPSGG